jgi:hypothetical protein
MPINIVTMNPPGSLPGMTNLPNTPATRPISSHPNIDLSGIELPSSPPVWSAVPHRPPKAVPNATVSDTK